MKKSIVLFLLVAYLHSFTNFGELVKLPAMIKHYAEHQKETPDIGFIEFLHIHYVHGNLSDKDASKDMQLPFKSTGNASLIGFSYFVPSPEFTLCPIIFNQSDDTLSCLKNPFYSSGYNSSIWQPPRFS